MLGVLAFGLAGLGCSALLPLTISFGQEELASVSAAVAGGVIAFYQLGYGIAAFGVGPLLDGGVELSTLYAVGGGHRCGDGRVVVRRRASTAEPASSIRCRASSVRRTLPPASRSRSPTAISGRSSSRSAAGCARIRGRSRAARRLRGRARWRLGPRAGADSVAEPPPGRQVRIRWAPSPTPAHRARAPERDPRARPLVGWRGRRARADRVVMEHVLHPQPGYPFSLAVSIEYALSDQGLSSRRQRRTSARTPARTGAARTRT